MRIEEFRELPPEALVAEIEKTREKVWKMRFQAKGEPIENPGNLRKLKRDIARMCTVLREKELEALPERRRTGLSRRQRLERSSRQARRKSGEQHAPAAEERVDAE